MQQNEISKEYEDANGVIIKNGDIVEICGAIFSVELYNDILVFRENIHLTYTVKNNAKYAKIIGDIHTTPHLLRND